jgi:hypothetical protein
MSSMLSAVDKGAVIRVHTEEVTGFESSIAHPVQEAKAIEYALDRAACRKLGPISALLHQPLEPR